MQIRNFSAAGLRAFGRTLASLPAVSLRSAPVVCRAVARRALRLLRAGSPRLCLRHVPARSLRTGGAALFLS